MGLLPKQTGSFDVNLGRLLDGEYVAVETCALELILQGQAARTSPPGTQALSRRVLCTRRGLSAVDADQPAGPYSWRRCPEQPPKGRILEIDISKGRYFSFGAFSKITTSCTLFGVYGSRGFPALGAGQLAPIPGGGTAFIPNPVPREVPLTARTITALARAENALGRLRGSVGRMVNPYLIARPLLRREAILSSRMEGTRTTAAKLVSVEAHQVDSPDLQTQEVANYVLAMNHGLALLKKMPLCQRFICELHSQLLTGVRGAEETPGEFRTIQNFIGRSDLASARFVPPPPSALKPLLADLEQYLNLEDNETSTPLLVRLALSHYQFETIHPFRDGNGRVGRC